ncbi:MAG TPA: acVLRF1 family peptidyl-tRNA hydrolase [Pseudonocardiaceae bacterium]|nr:acVLRF1 family peptidyl-tRNA hydrolase [Pseudonocardiaceae bacterium]
MAVIRELAGGGRAVEVEPERLAGFLERFATSHGGALTTMVRPHQVDVAAADGMMASIPVPFGPLRLAPGERRGLAADELIGHLLIPRMIGLVLVRLGGYSVGIARGGTVLTSTTGGRLVHSRSAAGGQSQRRFARRREGQAREALRAAADAAARVLLPRAAELEGVVLGGDSAALRTVALDLRLTALMERAEPRVLDIPEPRRAVLDEAARRARCVEVRLPARGSP